MSNTTEFSRVVIVNDSLKCTLDKSFGIDEKRKEELSHIMNDAIQQGINNPEKIGVARSMEIISEKCNNTNELAFTMYIFGGFMREKQLEVNQAENIRKIFGNLFK